MTMVFNGTEVSRMKSQSSFPASGLNNSSIFPPSSRYSGLAILKYEDNTSRSIAYVDRRFLPDPRKFFDLTTHFVLAGDRLDNIAVRYLGDPEQYWRIADANAAMQPEDLTKSVGGRIRITLPENVPGGQRA